MNIPSLSSATTDNIQIEKLSDSKVLSEEEKLDEAAKKFETVFINQMLKQMRKPVFKEDGFENTAQGGIYNDMINTQLSEGIARSGSLGLARQLKVQLARQLLTPEVEARQGPPVPLHLSTTKPTSDQ